MNGAQPAPATLTLAARFPTVPRPSARGLPLLFTLANGSPGACFAEGSHSTRPHSSHVQSPRPNTPGRPRMISHGQKIRVAIIGVGNCASSLVQGVQFYRDA